jgi:hypothetical protein
MITYLFGAGASKKSVPLVKEMVTSMEIERKHLIENFFFKEDHFDLFGQQYSVESALKGIAEDFDWALRSSAAHQSVDTFAKKLYLRRDYISLKRLKTVLSAFFLIIQSKRTVDPRYDSFFASILQENHLGLPDHLRILSWNYDYQFEKAYAEYSLDQRLESCQGLLNIYSKNSRALRFNSDCFGIIKLNGTASMILDLDKGSPYNAIDSVNSGYNAELIKGLLKNYVLMHQVDKTKEKLYHSLSFAWEDYTNGMPAVKNAINATKKTEVLVVIGYSFPFFNRLVDRDIIRSMTSLKKVYFQAPDAESLRERFLAIRNDLKETDLLIRKDVDQFVFPNEL